MFTVPTQTLLILPNYHQLSHLNTGDLQQSVCHSYSSSSLQNCSKNKTFASAQNSLLPSMLSHTLGQKGNYFTMGVKFRASTELFPVQAEKCSPLTLPPTAPGVLQKPQLPGTFPSLAMAGWLPENKGGSGESGGRSIRFIHQGKFVCNKGTKHWAKEAGQPFSKEEFKSREDKCVQTGPTPPVETDREVTSMLIPGICTGDIFSINKHKNTHSENPKLTSSRDICIACTHQLMLPLQSKGGLYHRTTEGFGLKGP